MRKPFSQSWRLALTYLGTIMTLSILFSSIIYMIVSSQLNRPLPPPPSNQGIQRALESNIDTQLIIDQRNSETRTSLIISLAALNAVMLIGGSGFSYYMARRTLRPIELAMQAQSQFVSDASHELRTPLTALLAINEVALRKKHIDSAKAQDTLQKNIVEINKLRELSEELLGLATTNHDSLRPETVWLDELTAESIEGIELAAKSKQIVVRNEVAHTELALHKATVKQILTIFLDNAVKYSSDNSSITVSAQLKSREAILSVTDEGMGIKATEHTKIFERFYRSDTARTRTDSSGHGLGLAIAKSTAEQHGYSISLESKQGSGSIFSLTIPA